MPKSTANVAVSKLEDVKDAICEYVQSHLVAIKAEKTGNTYFGLPEAERSLEALGLTGTLNISWFRLAELAQTEAATAERASKTVERMSPEQRRAWLEAELGKL